MIEIDYDILQTNHINKRFAVVSIIGSSKVGKTETMNHLFNTNCKVKNNFFELNLDGIKGIF